MRQQRHVEERFTEKWGKLERWNVKVLRKVYGFTEKLMNHINHVIESCHYFNFFKQN